MSEQNAATEQHTNANSPETGAGDQINWQERAEAAEKRFADTQAWGTQMSQEASRLRQETEQYNRAVAALASDDPDERRQAAEFLNVELDEEPMGQEQRYAELDPRQQARLDALEQRYQEAERNRMVADYQQRASAELARTMPELPEGLRGLVAEFALNQAEQTGAQNVDLKTAAEAVLEMADVWAQVPQVQTLVKKGWQQSKPQAAVTQAGGMQATQTQELDTRAKKAAWIDQQMAQLEADQTGI